MADRVLVDTSGWTHYLRGRGRHAGAVLTLVAEGRVWLTSTVLGEVFLGGVDLMDGRLGDLRVLPGLPTEAVHRWIRTRDPRLLRGVGWADCEIVHAAVHHRVRLLTADARQATLFEACRDRDLPR
jgi:predicted nucleic acid-binding protein